MMDSIDLRSKYNMKAASLGGGEYLYGVDSSNGMRSSF
jgi:hypothetical protein